MTQPGSTKWARDSLYQRIERQLQSDSWSEEDQKSGQRPHPITCYDFEYAFEGGRHVYFSKEKQNALLEVFCQNLHAVLNDPKDHIAQLDAMFSHVAKCKFSEYDDANKLATDSCQLMNRVPIVPVELPDIPTILSSEYLSCDSGREEPGQPRWSKITAVTYISTNVIRIALLVAMYGVKAPGRWLSGLLDLTADLLTTASRLSSRSATQEESCKWFLVRGFLWASWQRMSQLYFYSCAGPHVYSGFSDESGNYLVVRCPYPTPGLSLQEMSKQNASKAKPDYMCGYAFELIRNNLCAVGLDFRKFFDVFADGFGRRKGRCVPQQSSCTVGEATACQRFQDSKIENQSAHSGDCPGDCKRILWNKQSYTNVRGARAVNIVDCRADDHLSYQEASEQTLAISHVWSHGQGGRPEEGLNSCLHRRYRAIARSLDCNSYWLDAACIPDDRALRNEAIMKINQVFEDSKVTLICDRDIMSIDATSNDSWTRSCEIILITIMVCDWNLRAWTFLEAFRGRSNIHVLCKDNKVIPFQEIAQKVYQEGSIDIALLINAIPHLMRVRFGKETRKTSGAPSQPGFLGVEVSASHLSPRQFTRKGDDIVIWSLLLGEEVFDDAERFWENRKGQTVALTFLLSSAPRLSKRGWRWAPASSTAQILQDEHSGKSMYRILASDGTDGEMGLITEHGLRSQWLMHDFVGGRTGSRIANAGLNIELQPSDSRYQKNLNNVRRIFLHRHFWGALLRPIATQTWDKPVVHRSASNKVPLIVVGTNRVWKWSDKGTPIQWAWLGIYEWDQVEPLPEFRHLVGNDIYIT